MGSSKKDAPEVFDYLYSLDFGICYGPVQQFNQIWIKDKPVWCGSANRRMDVLVNQPELFGGDGGEGGAVGVVEVYIGDYTQKSSSQLAGRVGRTSDTMPGYLGLAHLFFRGDMGGYEPVLTATEEEDYANAEFNPAFQRGFRWATNNPYLPEMKASVTRLPTNLSTQYSAIYPPILSETGELISNPLNPDEPQENLIQPGLPIDSPAGWLLDEIPEDDYRNPWTKIDWQHLTDAQLEAGNIVGWTPTFTLNSNLVYNTADQTAVSSNFKIRVIAWDEAGMALQQYDWAGDDLVIVNDRQTLPDGAKYITCVFVVSSDAGPITERESGEITISIAFDEQENFDDIPRSGTLPLYTGASQDHESLGEVFDLLSLGYTEDSIDDGTVLISAQTQMSARMTGLGGSGPANFVGNTWIQGFGANSDGTINWDDPITPRRQDDDTPYNGFAFANDSGTGSFFNNTGHLILQPGTRFVSAFTNANRLSVILSYWTMQRSRLVISGPGYGRADLHCNVDQTLGLLPDANPAHIIYECLTNQDWGKGEDPNLIDTENFLAVAEVLYGEFLGLSMMWVQSSTIEEFIQEVLDHIQAFLFQDPATGLWTLKLIRADYDASTSPQLDPSNCQLANSKRPSWGDTINEITCTYTEPETEEEATVTAHNQGGIAMSGQINPEGRNYYGVRSPIVAQILANRDVESAGYPLWSGQATVSRSFWNIRLGDVVRLSWPEDQIDSMICRVMNIDYGDPHKRDIILDLVEDIAGIEQTTYTSGQGSEAVSDRVAAAPLDHEAVVLAPLPTLLRAGQTVDEIDAEYPVVQPILMADQNPRPLSIEVHTEVVLQNGSTVTEMVKSIPATRSTPLLSDLDAEVTSGIPEAIVEVLFLGTQQPGNLMMIGDQEDGSELIMLDSLSLGVWTVIRGVWDTVPVAWEAGATVWAMPDGTFRSDVGERVSGEERTYRFLPRTRYNTLAYEDAVDVTVTFSDRPHAPFRPADCELDGTGFAGVDYTELTLAGSPRPTEVVATWKTRNRETEDPIANHWDDDNVTPETGQTTVLQFYDHEGVYSHEIADLAGSSYNIPIASFDPLAHGTVRFSSRRDGITSSWGCHIPFDIRDGGYGLGYGRNYGGPS